MHGLKGWLGRFKETYFGPRLEFGAQIFNQLCIIGAALGVITALISLMTNAGINALIDGAVAVAALALLRIANRTGRFELCYWITVVVVFFGAFPAMFFMAGGYYSAMPCYFVFAIAFTAMMLRGRRRIVVTALEAVLYLGICLIAWRFPHTVSMTLVTEGDFALENISGFVFVGLALWIAISLFMRIYDRKQAQLEQLDLMKTQFLGNVSHEMKTPLAVISGYAQALRGELRGLPQAGEALAKSRQIVAEADRLALMISQLLDMTRIDEGRMRLSIGPVSVVEVIQDTLNAYGPALNRNGNRLLLRLDENLPPVAADGVYLARVLVNLLQNALRHTQNGTVTVSAAAQGAFVAVSVADTGAGIDPQVWPHLFERYKRVERGAGQKEARIGSDTGTGLGLYLCKHFVEAQGGVIAAESAPGKGARFTFTIPIHT